MQTIEQTIVLINSVDELRKLATEQITAQQVINKRLYINGLGWQSVDFSDEFSGWFIDEVGDLLGGRAATRHSVKLSLKYCKPQHWGLNRIFLEDRGWVYCAGQDYTSELNTIRKALK